MKTKNVGIDDYLLSTIKLYPNPTSDELSIEWGMEYEVTNIEVFDVYGKLLNTVEANTYSPQAARINVSNLANGMYFVRFTTTNGVATKSFVKK